MQQIFYALSTITNESYRLTEEKAVGLLCGAH